MPEEPRKNEPMQNYVYLYRNLNHVVDPLTVGSEEEWRESIREKYRQIDAGTYKKTRKKDNMGDLRPDYAEFRKMADLAVKDAATASTAETDVLRAEVSELKELVRQLTEKMPPQPIPIDPVVVKANKGPGSGVAPPKEEPTHTIASFGHQVVKADGVGWYDVVDINGKAVTEKSMRKSEAEKMAHDLNVA